MFTVKKGYYYSKAKLAQTDILIIIPVVTGN